ncbi:MAG: dihydroorotase [Actinomycetia bacterium]|nr:dihydroorotase [Actinomycetes bacterium]
MPLMLKNARCVDPAAGMPQPKLCDLLVRDGQIVEIGQPGSIRTENGLQHDLGGKLLVPGLVDMHVHLRDPGQEYKEDIASGGAAAAHGGFTAVLAMPNTKPITDSGSQVTYVLKKAAAVTRTRVHVAGALSLGEQGAALAEMGDMAAAGAVAFTDDGRGLQDAGMMRLAMEYAFGLGRPVLSHCQVESLVGNGQINEGVVSTRLGLAAWPAAGEEMQIARDIALAKLTGAALHIQHLTTAAGLEMVRAAKAEGLSVTCEVTPHHLFLDESALDETYNTNLKMNPPLRTAADAAALRAGLADGSIDCLASDHAPHAAHEKAVEFELAPFGTTGLETSLGLVLTELVATGQMSLAKLVERMAHAPRRILGLEPVSLAHGSIADLTVIDPDLEWVVSEEGFVSKSRNSAFIGRHLLGRATEVYVDGYASLDKGNVVEL